jgi:hypothetical protein
LYLLFIGLHISLEKVALQNRISGGESMLISQLVEQMTDEEERAYRQAKGAEEKLLARSPKGGTRGGKRRRDRKIVEATLATAAILNSARRRIETEAHNLAIQEATKLAAARHYEAEQRRREAEVAVIQEKNRELRSAGLQYCPRCKRTTSLHSSYCQLCNSFLFDY